MTRSLLNKIVNTLIDINQLAQAGKWMCCDLGIKAYLLHVTQQTDLELYQNII